MKKISTLLLKIAFSLATLFAVSAPIILASSTPVAVQALDPASGATFYATNEDNKYYQGIDEGLMGEDLIVALSTLTSTGFVSKSYSSLPSIYQYSDRSLNDPSLMQMVYTGTLKSFSPGGIPGSANKEHVWPASWYGSGNREEGAGTPGADAHNILPSATDLNSKRGTSAFHELPFATSFKALEFGTTNYGTVGNNDSYVWSTAFDRSNGENDDILYPAIGYRGTIARILMYVATRYRNDSRFPVMLHDQPTTLKIGRIGKLSTLLKWHYLEPPTEWEIRRNNEVATRWHHNRNPFVDHPEFATRIYYHLPEPDQSVASQAVKNIIDLYGSPQDTIRLSKTSLSLKEGMSETVTVVSNPNSETITWSSSDPSVATVDQNGLITGLTLGSAIITAQGATSSATVRVTVQPESSDILISSITFNPSNLSLKVGYEQTLNPTILPVDATNKTLIYNSSNTSVVVVNENGRITAIKAGTATISASSQDGSSLSATLNVTVTALPTTAEEGWELVTSVASLKAGDELVMASNEKGVVATALSGAYFSHTSASFSGDLSRIVTLPAAATRLTLGGTSGNWTLANRSGGLLGTSAAKTVGFDIGTTTWTIAISNGATTLSSTNTTYGRMLYNSSAPRFTTYTSALSSSMLLINLYRYTEGAVDTAKVDAYTYADLFMTRTAEECAVNHVLNATWTYLASEYAKLSTAAKDYVYAHYETDAVMVALIARYSLILEIYGYTNFLTNSAGDLVINEVVRRPNYEAPRYVTFYVLGLYVLAMTIGTVIYFGIRKNMQIDR